MKPTTLSTFPVPWRAALVSLTALVTLALAACDAQAPSASPSSPADAAGGAAVSPDATVPEVLAEQDPYTRIRKLAALLPQLGPERVPEVRRVLQKSRGGMDAAELELLMRYWATYEPEAATDWAYKLSAPRFRLSAISVAVERWAESDPEAAVAAVTGWAQSGDAEVAQATQLALVQGWFRKDREALMHYIRGLGTSIERQRAALGYALALARADGSEAVMEWAEAIPEDDERWKLTIYRQVTSALAWTDADAAERWCAAHCEGPYGKAMRSVLIRVRLANGEPGADVVAWAAQAPEGDPRARALRIAWETWALRERQQALDWMEEQVSADGEPKEPWVPLLYGAYARQLSVYSPAKAIVWAGRVQNEAREELTVRIARRWLKQDREAAEAWIASSWLSDDAKARARNLQLPGYLPKAAAPDAQDDAAPEADAEDDATGRDEEEREETSAS